WLGQRSERIRGPPHDPRPLRGGAALGSDRALRARPRAAKTGEGDFARPLGQLANVQGQVATQPRTQSCRLSRQSSNRLSRNVGTHASGAARVVPVGVPELFMEQ